MINIIIFYLILITQTCFILFLSKPIRIQADSNSVDFISFNIQRISFYHRKFFYSYQSKVI